MKRKIFYFIALFFITTASFAYGKESTPFLFTARSAKAMGIYVGEEGKKWPFPSDHIPIGFTYNNIHIVSWNVLHNKNINAKRLLMNSSTIIKEHEYIKGTGITVRDRHVIDIVRKLLYHSTHPRSIIALQECSKPFLKELSQNLPSSILLLACGEEVLLVDQKIFTLVKADSALGMFDVTTRTCQEVLVEVKKTKEVIRFINIHVPTDNSLQSRAPYILLGKYLKKNFTPETTTIVMGDINCDEIRLERGLHEAFYPKKSPFVVLSPYPSFFSFVNLWGTALDHFIISSKEGGKAAKIECNRPDQVLKELTTLVGMMTGAKKKVFSIGAFLEMLRESTIETDLAL